MSAVNLIELSSMEVTPLQKVVVAIFNRNESDFIAVYDDIEEYTELPRKDIKKLVSSLKEIGVVKRGYGINDDGLLAGSGFYIPLEYRSLISEVKNIVEGL